ncbi:MAG TPA: FxsA family protein [Acidimicrobiales bacterium]|nr:FxsA family protein [Acidimicrobiales bacterium]
MFAILALLFLVVPVIEVFLIAQVAGSIGFGSTLLVIIAISVAGAWLVKYQGLSIMRRLQEQLGRGQMPTNELIDGGLILFAGALMLTPGFLTDALGLVLLVPPTRAVVRAIVKTRFSGQMIVTGPGFRSEPHDADGIWDADSWETESIDDRPELL